MVHDMVHLRIDPKMRKEIQDAVRANLFSTETEFIRDAIRRHIELHQKIQVLNALRGSIKRSKNHKKTALSDVFRTVGLEE